MLYTKCSTMHRYLCIDHCSNMKHTSNIMAPCTSQCTPKAQLHASKIKTLTPSHPFQFINHNSLTLNLLACNPLSEQGIKLKTTTFHNV